MSRGEKRRNVGNILPNLVTGAEATRIMTIHDTLEARGAAIVAAICEQYQRKGFHVVYLAFERIPRLVAQRVTPDTLLDYTVDKDLPLSADGVFQRAQQQSAADVALVIGSAPACIAHSSLDQLTRLICQGARGGNNIVVVYNHSDCCTPKELAALNYLTQTSISLLEEESFQGYSLVHKKRSGKVVTESGRYRVTKTGQVECQKSGQAHSFQFGGISKESNTSTEELAQHVTTGLVLPHSEERGTIQYEKDEVENTRDMPGKSQSKTGGDNDEDDEDDEEDPDADLDI